ncbi:MAG TPA: UPF0149 family protein [Casimicrobiaceae bacterium]|nr:UPF0149 family protein [Casimicrobiaceae bacterium]
MTSTSLVDGDLARLEELLATHGDNALGLDELQAFCAAISMGPDQTPPAQWHHAVLDLADDARPSDELQGLLDRYCATTAQALNEGTLAVSARQTRSGRTDKARWCRAFLAGVDASETDWFDAADFDDLREMLAPIEAVADVVPENERSVSATPSRRLVHAASLIDHVLRLRDYWRIVRAPPTTVRRDVPKVGRNAACPCGSGRKFKQCHGKG